MTRRMKTAICLLCVSVAALRDRTALGVQLLNPGFETAGIGGATDSDGWIESGTFSRRTASSPRSGSFAHQLGGVNNAGLDSGRITQNTLDVGMPSLVAGDIVTAEFFAQVFVNISGGGSATYKLEIVNGAGTSIASTGNLVLTNAAGYVKYDTTATSLTVPPLAAAPNNAYGARLTIDVTQFSNNTFVLGGAIIDDTSLAVVTPFRWNSETSGAWATVPNWSQPMLPGVADTVVIDPIASLTVAGPANPTTVAVVHLGGSGTGRATLDLNVADLHSTAQTFVHSDGELLLENGRNLSASRLVNDGIVRGDGTIQAVLENHSQGEVRVAAGERLYLASAAAHSNAGKIEALGTATNLAEFEFTGPLTNAASTGLMTGHHAIMRFTGGLTNGGALTLTGGSNDVSGDIINNASGTISVAGGASATFYDDVVQNGTLQVIKVGSTNSVAVFAGAFTGSGGSSGGGDIFFLGDLRPGNSPATVTFANNVAFGLGANLQIEVGGTTGGSQYDQVHATGELSVGGALHVSLVNNFAPVAGNKFDILDWGTLSGTFSALQFPALPGSLVWSTNQLYTAGILSVVDLNFLPGDFNRDHQATAADVPAMLAALTNLNVYKANNQNLSDANLTAIGDLNGDGAVTNADIQSLLDLIASSGGGATVTVPEPATILLLASALLAFTLVEKRRQQNGGSKTGPV